MVASGKLQVTYCFVVYLIFGVHFNGNPRRIFKLYILSFVDPILYAIELPVALPNVGTVNIAFFANLSPFLGLIKELALTGPCCPNF